MVEFEYCHTKRALPCPFAFMLYADPAYPQSLRDKPQRRRDIPSSLLRRAALVRVNTHNRQHVAHMATSRKHALEVAASVSSARQPIVVVTDTKAVRKAVPQVDMHVAGDIQLLTDTPTWRVPLTLVAHSTWPWPLTARRSARTHSSVPEHS